jgi:hypothetical protein
MARHVRVARLDLPQPHDGVVSFEWESDGRRYPVALDYWDYPEVNERCAAEAALIFKMQHRRGGYGLENVVPGGFVPALPRGRPGLYRMLPRVRRERERRAFRCDVYGRFSVRYATETRRRAFRLLSAQSRLSYEGSLRVTGYGRYLLEAARSRVCLDLPGNGDLCHRLVEYLAIGVCVVGIRHRTELHVPLEEGRQIVYVADDLSDLVEVCERLAHDSKVREEMAREARGFFDRYLHRDQLAAYYLNQLMERLP